MKIGKKIQMKIFIFTAVKNRCMLHGLVIVMHEITCVKDEVKELKNPTDLILSAVSKLAKSMEIIWVATMTGSHH